MNGPWPTSLEDVDIKPSDRPLPVRLGLCDPIPDPRMVEQHEQDYLAWSDRRRIVIDGVRQPWSDEERDEFLNQAYYDAAQEVRFEE